MGYKVEVGTLSEKLRKDIGLAEEEIWVDSYTWDADPTSFYPDELHSVDVDLYFYRMGPGVVPVVYTLEVALVDPVTGNLVASSAIDEEIGGSGHEPYSFPITMPTYDATFDVYFRGYIGENLVYEYPMGTVTVIPALTPAFVYSNEEGAHRVKSNANYSWLLFVCDITNPTARTETEVITLWNYNAFSGATKSLADKEACDGIYGACPVCKDPGQIELTLAPGESFHYRFCGYNCSTLYVGDQYLWLRDDRGGESAHKRCGKAPPEGFPWEWVGLGGGIAAAAGIGVAISRRKGGK